MKFEVGEKKALKLDNFLNYLGVWVCWTGGMCLDAGCGIIRTKIRV